MYVLLEFPSGHVLCSQWKIIFFLNTKEFVIFFLISSLGLSTQNSVPNSC